MAERFVARPAPFRILFIVLGAIGFVLLGAWIAGLFGPPPRPGQQWAGWLAIAFFGLCAVVSARRLFEHQDLIVVDRNGLYWRRWSQATIPWSAIEWIEPRTVRRNRFLCIHLKDRSQFPTGRLTAWGSAANRSLGYGDFAMTTLGTDRTLDELLAALRRHAPAAIQDL